MRKLLKKAKSTVFGIYRETVDLACAALIVIALILMAVGFYLSNCSAIEDTLP